MKIGSKPGRSDGIRMLMSGTALVWEKGVPPPCKPDSVHPGFTRSWTVISLNPAFAGRPACAECD